MKEYTPIVMHCTQEQFESVNQVLIDNGLNPTTVPYYNPAYPYLFLNSKGKLSRADDKFECDNFKGDWDESIFLTHCGINIQPKDPVFIERYNITDKVKELLKECKEQGFQLNIDNGVIILKQI